MSTDKLEAIRVFVIVLTISLRIVTLMLGVSNGPKQFESARKIWPLLELLAKIR